LLNQGAPPPSSRQKGATRSALQRIARPFLSGATSVRRRPITRTVNPEGAKMKLGNIFKPKFHIEVTVEDTSRGQDKSPLFDKIANIAAKNIGLVPKTDKFGVLGQNHKSTVSIQVPEDQWEKKTGEVAKYLEGLSTLPDNWGKGRLGSWYANQGLKV